MSEPFLAEIRIVGFNFAPKGWAFCDGQILPINQNQSLYSLLGTTYGGDGRTSFALPDLRSRAPMHRGEGHLLGQRGGEETHTLGVNEIPSHNHGTSFASNAADGETPEDAMPAKGEITVMYGPAANLTAMDSNMVNLAGGGQGHDNMQPFLTLAFCIALQGLFPSRN